MALFVKGQSGNPGGRPKGLPEFRQKCREHSQEALDALLEGLKDPSRSIPAATLILAYAWGKPSEPKTGEGGEGPMQLKVTIVDERAGSEAGSPATVALDSDDFKAV